MPIQKGTVTKRIRDAIAAEAVAPASTDISDATTVGKALITAASASAARTTLGAAPALAAAPANATAAGVAGTVAYDATHVYVCIAASTWVRATTATW